MPYEECLFFALRLKQVEKAWPGTCLVVSLHAILLLGDALKKPISLTCPPLLVSRF